MKLPCGKCVGCKLDRARDHAIRAVHEAQMFAREGKGSIFATLTFDDANLPHDRSVSVKFIQRFHYRLRDVIGPFRFLLSAEYGDRDKRPHYHAIYFGHDFREDRYPWKRSGQGLLYRSPRFETVWTFGHCLFADFTMDTAGYTARYTVKKPGGEEGDEQYRRREVDPVTGQVREWFVSPEFLLSSRKPGLGASWFDAFKSDVFPSDFIVINGERFPVPRYYLNRLADDEREAVRLGRKAGRLERNASYRDAREEAELVKLSREERGVRQVGRQRLGGRFSADNSDSRLLVKHESAQHRAARLVRTLDGES